ncbi:MAG: hypothetical protein ACI8QG_000174 [Flavobacteriales bacterium]
MRSDPRNQAMYVELSRATNGYVVCAFINQDQKEWHASLDDDTEANEVFYLCLKYEDHK